MATGSEWDGGGKCASIGSERRIGRVATRPRWPAAGGASGSGAALVAGGEELDAAGSGRRR